MFRHGCFCGSGSWPPLVWCSVTSFRGVGFHGLRARFVRHSSLWVCALAILPGRSATACPVPVQVGLGSGLFPVAPPHLLLWVCALAVGLVVPPPWSLVGLCSGHWVRSLRHSLAVGLFRVRSFSAEPSFRASVSSVGGPDFPRAVLSAEPSFRTPVRSVGGPDLALPAFWLFRHRGSSVGLCSGHCVRSLRHSFAVGLFRVQFIC